MSLLGDALFTTTQRNVLGLLYSRPDRSFYTKEILRLTAMGVATIKRELDRMLAADILTMIKIGNQHHYQANPKCPIYHELLAIVKKTFGVVDVVRVALEPISKSINYSFIYGSIAKGKEKAESDIDLMVIGRNLSYAKIMELLIPVEQKLERTVNPNLYTLADFLKKQKNKNGFLLRVMQQEKLNIIGSENDLRES